MSKFYINLRMKKENGTLEFLREAGIDITPYLSDMTELRLRLYKPITIETANTRVSIRQICDAKLLERVLLSVCGESYHTVAKRLAEGYITIPGGHRIGIAGTMSGECVTDVTSMNIRVAREHKGVSDKFFLENFHGKANPVTSLLIGGEPLSGKTTFLRDLIRNISSAKKVAVVDERGEIAGKFTDTNQPGFAFDLGGNTDLLDGYGKRRGFEAALRSLSPDYIAVDEMSRAEEREFLSMAANSGVGVIFTRHCGVLDSLPEIVSGKAILLGTRLNIGKIIAENHFHEL